MNKPIEALWLFFMYRMIVYSNETIILITKKAKS